jgi:hypothetical protein
MIKSWLGGFKRLSWVIPGGKTCCWDQITEGYSILNTGKNVKVGNHKLDSDDCKSVNSTADSSKCT